jgi:hypothetical protein
MLWAQAGHVVQQVHQGVLLLHRGLTWMLQLALLAGAGLGWHCQYQSLT